jgi:hypothetical protein
MSLQGHSVQFYKDDTFFFTESVAGFIKEGLQANDTVIIVATAHHREELQKVLTPEQMAHDKLIFADAGELLAKFLVNDWPNDLRFKQVVGGMIAQACQHGSVRVFGEMVAILWAEGKAQAAIHLEELWNTLIAEQSFVLLCGYPVSKFSGDNDSLKAISQLHNHAHVDAPVSRLK